MRTLGRVLSGCVVLGVVLFVLIVGSLALFYGATSVYGLYLARANEQPAPTEPPVVDLVDPGNQQGTDQGVDTGQVDQGGGGTNSEVITPVDPVDCRSVSLPQGSSDWVCVDRTTPSHKTLRLGILKPGEAAKGAMIVTQDFKRLPIRRVVPDDVLNAAYALLPDGTRIDFIEQLTMITVSAGGTGDASLDAFLEVNDVNLVDGELLPQNSRIVVLKNVPAGTVLVFEVHDDENKQVNVGVTLDWGDRNLDQVDFITNVNLAR